MKPIIDTLAAVGAFAIVMFIVDLVDKWKMERWKKRMVKHDKAEGAKF